jgi:hypothetical protein
VRSPKEKPNQPNVEVLTSPETEIVLSHWVVAPSRFL